MKWSLLLSLWTRVHDILTTAMTRIVVDKSTDHAKPHSICEIGEFFKGYCVE